MKGLKLMICATALSASAFAQVNDSQAAKIEKHTVQTNLFKDNWFIGANIGGQYYFGDQRKSYSRKKLLSPVFEINVGKWFTPALGLRMGFGGYQAKGYASTETAYAYKKVSNNVYRTKWGVLDLHADVMFNPINMIGGYRADRLYNIIPYASVGYARNITGNDNELSLGLGLINSFRINKRLDINVEARGLVYNDVMDGNKGGRNYEGSMAVMAGVTYRLGKTGWEKGSGVSIAELEAVQSKLRDMNAENEALNRKVAVMDQDLKQKDQDLQNAQANQANGELEDAMEYTAFFAINKAYLSQKEAVNLEAYADLIKKFPNSKFVITGYADKQTGSAEYNEKLSKLRAEAVYNTLVDKYGVNADQLTMEYKGGVDTMYHDNSRLSRAAIVRIVK